MTAAMCVPFLCIIVIDYWDDYRISIGMSTGISIGIVVDAGVPCRRRHGPCPMRP